MSVQLFVYPQGGVSDDLIVDGQAFTTMGSAINTDTTNTVNIITDLMSIAPPTAPGMWSTFRATANVTPPIPTVTSGDLYLETIGGGINFSGVYQQLSGLVAGQSYTVEIDFVSTPSSGIFYLTHATTTQTSYSQTVSLPTANTAWTFTAYSSTDTIFLSLGGSLPETLIIDTISVSVARPKQDYIGKVICDLYEDEEIPLTLSVDNFKNVAEKIQSYSKDFNLPATKRNNKILGNIFEITRTVENPYDFNPYAQTRATLNQDGFLLFDGYLKLIDIQERDGEISYNVNLYAQTIALADTLRNKTFNDINFYELEHTYKKTVIKGSWSTDGLALTNPLSAGTYAGTVGASVTDVLKYPFVDWTGQILIANGATGSNATPGMPELTSLEQAFRPWIKIKYLIDRIFSGAGYSYSSTLFDSADFGELFMDFNWGGDSMPSVVDDTSYTGTYKYGTGAPFFNTDETFLIMGVIDNSMTGGQATSFVPPNYQTTGGDIYKIVATADNELYHIDYSWTFFNDLTSSNDTFILRWRQYDASTGLTHTIHSQTLYIKHGKIGTMTGSISVGLDNGDKLYTEYAGTGPYSGTWAEVDKYLGRTGGTVTYTVSSSLVGTGTINALRGDLNQWDFLKGIFTMFNLVTLQDPNDASNIIIESYKDVFINTGTGTRLASRGINFDWTNKVDLKDVKLTPLNDLKKTTFFKYAEEDDDYIFNVYKQSSRGYLYGSKEFSASALTLLEGEAEVVAEPFAATISKQLGASFSDMIVPTIYSMGDDGVPTGFDNKPRILYNSTGATFVPLSGTYYIPSQNGQASENQPNFFTFSHLTSVPSVLGTTNDFNFGECQYLLGMGNAVSSNLFNNYWLPYYNELYNPNTRTMEIKVNLTPGDIASFEFSDYVMIKNRIYRVNRIDYKPKDLSTVEFILIT